MLAEERFSQILALLAEKRTATVQELCEALNVSESTIRRDLLELDRQGRVNKVHGGATLPSSQFRADEPTMEAKETLAVSQKNTIAKAAAALIQADDFVYLDAGSTTLAVARAVSGAALDAHYVTNGIAHAAAASLCLAACCAPRPRPSSARQPWRRCSSTTSPRRFWGPTALIWSPGSPPRTPRKPPSRPVPPAAPTRYGFWPMTLSSAASTRP